MNPAGSNALSESLIITREDGALCLRLAGQWTLGATSRPAPTLVQDEFAKDGPLPNALRFDLTGVTSYDTALITFLLKCHDFCATTKTPFDFNSLPDGPRKLLRLATSVSVVEDVRPHVPKLSFLAQVGIWAENTAEELADIFRFLGECTTAFGRFLTGRARFRWSDVWLEMQHCGADALPIVTLIAFLMGLILAYVGAVTLRPYGGLIFIANLVGLAMVREMSSMMTGVVMSGRTGAAFAAQLGTMKVSEEISALRTMGLSPIEYLVLPRMIALFLMFPLLTLYTNFIGMFGGLVVGMSMGLSFSQFTHQLISAVDLTNFSVGMIKSFVFGLIVAATGCLRGMQCGNSSAAVGLATTRAVVTGITCMVAADAIFAVIFNTWECNLTIRMAIDELPPHVGVRDLTMAYGDYVVMRDLSFDIQRGEIFIIMGASGCGKSTLLRHLTGLLQPAAGKIFYDGVDFTSADDEQRNLMLRKFGVMFQGGALWSSLTLAENVAFPLEEFTDLPKEIIRETVELKLALVGLRGFEDFYPAEISGGMCKRASLARAMALDPDFLFFDEPSAGLDPVSARRLDELILQLRDSLGTTVVVVTHELASIYAIADRAIYLDVATHTMGGLGNPSTLRSQSTNENLRLFLNRGMAGLYPSHDPATGAPFIVATDPHHG